MPNDDSALQLPLPPTTLSDDRPHIYVINSDPNFLEMIGDLLEDEEVQVTLEQMRPNVEVTVDNVRGAQPMLLILDVVPYQPDAGLLLERLAADEDLYELPVMLASTSAGVAEALAQRYSALVRDILPKPFNLDEFYRKLHRLTVLARVV